MKRRSLIFKSAFAAVATLLGATRGRAQSHGSNALVGSWDVSTTNLDGNLPPGVGVTSRRLHTYSEGGTAFDNSGLSGEMPAQGVWEYVGSNTFETTFVRLIRDAQGQVIATNKVRTRVRLRTEDEYENEAKSEVFNLAGATVFSWRAKGEGHRIKLEPFD
jgi:hypothetical protein